MKRRSLLAAAASLPLISALPGLAQSQLARRIATPRQTEGPFYPGMLKSEADSELIVVGGKPYAHGEPLVLTGTVTSLNGAPLAGAVIEIWQCDHAGHYHHPGDGGRADAAFQGYGRATADAEGRYRFTTIRPVSYPGRTPHIHFKVRQGARVLLTTQMYVAGEPQNERDGPLSAIRDPAQREALIVRLAADGGAQRWRGNFPLVVESAPGA